MTVKVLLLLAGQSKRFWPLKEKPLFPICGKTLLEHQMERLEQAGLTDIILIGSDNNIEAIKTRFPTVTTVIQQDLELGMRGALLDALPQCGTEAVLVVSGNDIFSPEVYNDLQKTAHQKDVNGAILAQKVDTYFPGGYLTLDGDHISGIQEKPGEGNEPSNLVNIVAHIHNNAADLLEALQDIDQTTDDGYEQALAKLFTGGTYRAVAYDGTWQAVKYPWHLLDLLPVLLAEQTEPVIHESASIHPSAVIEGNVYIGPNTRVLAGACIVGPCYIGADCIIANNALVRGSSIGDHSIVGFCTEVKASVWHSHVWTHMTYSGDSVVGQNVSFGAGCVTGNLRLDEAMISSRVKDQLVATNRTKFGSVFGNDCRLGIQVSFDPGTKIGSGTFVSSASHVSNDIPDQSFARMKAGELVVSPNKTAAPKIEDREQYRRKI